jgi:hypothetical protein
VAVCGQVNFGAQPAAGASECVVGRLVAAFGPFLTAPAVLVGPDDGGVDDTVQPMSSTASAAARTAARIFSQVPSTAHLISRL